MKILLNMFSFLSHWDYSAFLPQAASHRADHKWPNAVITQELKKTPKHRKNCTPPDSDCESHADWEENEWKVKFHMPNINVRIFS